MSNNQNQIFFWDLFEIELIRSIIENPSEFNLTPLETPQYHAKEIRRDFEKRNLLLTTNLRTNTFRRLAYRLRLNSTSRSSFLWAEKYYSLHPIPLSRKLSSSSIQQITEETL